VYTEGHILLKCGTEKVVSDVVTMFREGPYLHEKRDAEDRVLLFFMSVSSENNWGGPRASDGVGYLIPMWIILDGRVIIVAVASSGYADSMFQ